MLIITGPTCSGKSALALSIAKNLGGVIINADSQQVYAELPILTNHPVDCGSVPHALYGCISVSQPYSVVRWLADIESVAIRYKDNNLIVVGGTGLYIDALRNGLSDIPSDLELKMKLRLRCTREGLGPICKELFNLDPISAERISPNDQHRVLRAYEVFMITGKSIYHFFNKKLPPAIARLIKKQIALLPDRASLYHASDARFLDMVTRGAINEVRNASEFIDGKCPVGIHGYEELKKFINGQLSLDNAISIAQRRTRQYIKRQMTWIRHQQSNFVMFDNAQDALRFACG